ncbi:MAG: methionine gamma-lyase family protein, partial [Clostridiales Family XIII bacterium]|nr:methionine gamma-lyase family protein [Clostridiales Family XIII bacterium]
MRSNINTNGLLMSKFNIDKRVIDLIEEAEREIEGLFGKLDDVMAFNQYKVLDAFQKNRVNSGHFAWNTGYGYGDAGREAVERVYADVMDAEAALARPLIVSG